MTVQERIVATEPIYEGKVVHLKVHTIELANGSQHKREVVHHFGAVAVVALDEADQVFLVRQYRSGAQKELLELPAGGLMPGEDRLDCARRELQEEIKYYPEALTRLGDFWVAASYTTELITIYLARGLRASALAGDDDEQISVERIPFADALEMALTNRIEDSKTVIGLVWAARHLSML